MRSTDYLGRWQLGERLPLSVRCRSSADTPAEPASAPLAMIYSDSGFVTSQLMPITDRYGVTGVFAFELLLDGRFAVGRHTVIYHYTISSVPLMAQQDFEVVAAGNFDGAGLSMFYYRRPGAGYLLTHQDSGRLIRKRNPRA